MQGWGTARGGSAFRLCCGNSNGPQARLPTGLRQIQAFGSSWETGGCRKRLAPKEADEHLLAKLKMAAGRWGPVSGLRDPVFLLCRGGAGAQGHGWTLGVQGGRRCGKTAADAALCFERKTHFLVLLPSHTEGKGTLRRSHACAGPAALLHPGVWLAQG